MLQLDFYQDLFHRKRFIPSGKTEKREIKILLPEENLIFGKDLGNKNWNKILFVDGGCSGNSQRDLRKRNMVMVVCNRKGVPLVEKTEIGGSNNIAEFLAILEAVKINCHFQRSSLILSDSKIALGWASLAKKGKVPGSRRLQAMNDPQKVLDLFKEFFKIYVPQIKFSYIPRHKNLAGIYIENKYS
jgi:ribonuclease HI